MKFLLRIIILSLVFSGSHVNAVGESYDADDSEIGGQHVSAVGETRETGAGEKSHQTENGLLKKVIGLGICLTTLVILARLKPCFKIPNQPKTANTDNSQPADQTQVINVQDPNSPTLVTQTIKTSTLTASKIQLNFHDGSKYELDVNELKQDIPYEDTTENSMYYRYLNISNGQKIKLNGANMLHVNVQGKWYQTPFIYDGPNKRS